MGVDGSIASSSGQVFIFSIRNVEASARIAILLRKTVIYQKQLNMPNQELKTLKSCQTLFYNVYLVTVTANTHEEVIGFDIAMDEVFRVNIFNSTDHLISQHQHGLHSESTRAEIEQIL